jgi:hypothetical protein
MKALHTITKMAKKIFFLPSLALLLALTSGYAQAPVNDLCSGALPLSCGQTVTGSTTSATIDQAPACGLSLPRFGVWYTLAGGGDRVTLTTCNTGTNYDTQIGVYSGSCASLVCVAGNNNDPTCTRSGRYSTVSFTANSGTTYYIWVTGVIDARGNFTLTSTCSPANDLCTDARVITCGQTQTGSTAAATPDFAVTTTCGTSFTNTAKGVWFSFTAATSGSTEASLCGSGFDTKIGVFTGTCSALTCVGGNDDNCGLQSRVTFNATAGTTYLIYVAGFGTASGNYSLTVTCASAPPPPPPPAPVCNCSNTTAFGTVTAPTTNSAISITTCAFAGEYNTINSAVAGNSYTFTSSVAGDYLTVRQGTPGGTVLGCGTAPLTVTATANGPIYVHVNTNSACGTQNTCRATTVACTSCAGPPPPPGCSDATPLTCGSSVSGTTVGAPVATGLGTCTTTLNTAGGRWHTLFVANTGTVTVNTCSGTGFDSKLGVFTGTCGALVCVAGNDDACGLQSSVTFSATGGTTYLIYVTGFGAAAGAYQLSASCSTTLTAPNTNPAATLGQTVSLPEGDLIVGQVFPNPLSGNMVNLRLDSPKETEAIVRFLDQTGREVMFMESDLNVGDNLLQLNVSRLPAGTYFVTVQVEGRIIPRRLVIPRA